MTTTPDIIDVVPFEKNPRRITKQRKKDLRENLARFGDLGGIVVNIRTGESISGNQRCAVMDVNACERVISKRYDKPNAQGTVAVGYVLFEGDEFSYREVDWDDETAAEAAIKANVDAGFFEADLLVEHYDVADLMDWGLDGIIPESDLEAAASRREEIKETDNPPSIDEAVALRKKWGTETGQLWIIPSETAGGVHRLLCGDSTEAEHVKRVMNGERAQLFATDPPYLVDYTGKNRPEATDDEVAEYAQWDSVEDGEAFYSDFLAAAIAEALLPDAAWYCWYASSKHTLVEQAWIRAGAFAHQQIIWAKSNGVMGRSHYRWAHEPCLYGWIRGNQPPKRGQDMPSTVWSIEGMAKVSETLHPTSKPLGVFTIPMDQHTRRGEICYEPFSGSGSQLVAGESCGRLVYGMERAPEYVAVILERASRLGLEPTLEEGS